VYKKPTSDRSEDYLKRSTLLLILCATAAGLAQADAVVTFDAFPLGGFTSGVESGFTINAVNTNVYGNTFGFPTPSVGVGAPDAVATITFTDGGVFTYVSLDLDTPAITTEEYTPVGIAGYFGATLVGEDFATTPATAGSPQTFDAFNLAGVNITSLVLTVVSNDFNSPLVDNVTFDSAVPEPATLSMLGLGICGILGFSWKRKKA
jgi:hypothetical protein